MAIKNAAWFYHKESENTFVVSDNLGLELLSANNEVSNSFPNEMLEVVKLAAAAPALFRNLVRLVGECENNGILNETVLAAKELLVSISPKDYAELAPPKSPKPILTEKQKFLDYFNSEAYDNELDPDEKKVICLQSLQGDSDITYDFLEQLCSEYNVNLKAIVN